MKLALDHISYGYIIRFQEFWASFQLLARRMINLFFKLNKLANYVSCVTIQDRNLASTNLAWMIPDNHLSSETIVGKFFADTSSLHCCAHYLQEELHLELHGSPQ